MGDWPPTRGAAHDSPFPAAGASVDRGGVRGSRRDRVRVHDRAVPSPPGTGPAALTRRQSAPVIPPADSASHDAVVGLLRIAPVTDELADRFAAAGHVLYLVGGSVRDALLGRLPSGGHRPDLDFTTDARPEQTQAILTGWADAVWDTGIAFGTVGAAKAGTTYEVTTYRAERYDRVSRNPEVVFGDSLDDDLLRRDFTINAMAVQLPVRDLLAGSSRGGRALLAGSSGGGRDPGQWGRRFVDPYGGRAALARRELDTP